MVNLIPPLPQTITLIRFVGVRKCTTLQLTIRKKAFKQAQPLIFTKENKGKGLFRSRTRVGD